MYLMELFSKYTICHCLTNEEKADKFPSWKANGKLFQAKRKKGNRTAYIIEKIN